MRLGRDGKGTQTRAARGDFCTCSERQKVDAFAAVLLRL